MRDRKVALLLVAIFLVAQIAFAQVAAERESKKMGFGKELKKSPKPLSSVKQQKIDPAVLSADSDTVDVIIEGSLKDTQTLEKKKFAAGDFYSAKIRKSEIQNLEKSGAIKKVWLEKTYKPLLDVAVPLVNASTFYSAGYNGSGISVCVIDTGVNSSHPALSPRIIAEKDFVTTDSDGNNPMDYNGHGTHVAGIVASSDSVYSGVAPGAGILNAKVFSSSTGGAPESRIMEAIDWCIAQGASVLTMSLGGPEIPSDGSDALSRYADAAVDIGKVVTIAAGNSGPSGNTNCRTSDATGSSYSICSPGLSHKAITVGSTKSGKTLPVDGISSYSSRGPTADGRIKPDVAAPGESIMSSVPSGYGTKSGTSMATPMVAGLAALALQARNMTPAELKALLMNTAVELGATGKDSTYGAGRVDGRLFAEINNTGRYVAGSEYRIHEIFVNGSEIRATLYWPENSSYHSDLDLYLLDPAGNTRASSTSQYNTDEIISLQEPTPSGYWKLLVDPYDIVANQTYAIASNIKLSGQLQNRTGSASNVVYHAINASNNLTLNLGWNYTDVDLDLYLYNTSGNLANYSVLNGTNYEIVSYNNPSGEMLARIVPVALGNSSIRYSLTSSSAASEQITDNVSPGITINGPLNTTYGTENITLAFNATDSFATNLDCTVIAYNFTRSLAARNGSVSTINISVSEGSRNVTVTCADWSYNRGNATVYFSVNATPPENINPLASYPSVTFTSGNGSAFSPNGDGIFDSINFTVNVSEIVDFGTTRLYASNGTRVKSFQSADNTTSISKQWNGCFTESCAAGYVPDGVYTIQITTTNSSGYTNSTNLTETITVDTTPISIYFADPTPNNETTGNASTTINITTSEAPASLLLEWNGVNYSMSGNGTNWSRTFNKLYGNYTFRAHARDYLWNWNVSETRWFYSNYTVNSSRLIERLNQTLSARNITTALLNSSGGSAGSSLIPSERYTLRFGAGGIVVEMADFLGMDLNTSAAADITMNITGERNVSFSFTQAGGTLDSYVWIELNNTLPEGNFTPKVTFPLRQIYFYLNGTEAAPVSTRIENACNSNASNVPCYNDTGIGVVLHLPSFSGGSAGNDTSAPSLSVSSPYGSYSSSSVSLNYSVSDSVAVDECWYSLNGSPNVTLAACSNATITASEGSNTIRLYANDTSGNANMTAITFAYEPPEPTTTTAPSGGGSPGIITTTVKTTTTVPETTTSTAAVTTTAAPETAAGEQIFNGGTGEDNHDNTSGSATGLAAGSTSETAISVIVVLAAATVAALYAHRSMKIKRPARKKSRSKSAVSRI